MLKPDCGHKRLLPFTDSRFKDTVSSVAMIAELAIAGNARCVKFEYELTIKVEVTLFG